MTATVVNEMVSARWRRLKARTKTTETMGLIRHFQMLPLEQQQQEQEQTTMTTTTTPPPPPTKTTKRLLWRHHLEDPNSSVPSLNSTASAPTPRTPTPCSATASSPHRRETTRCDGTTRSRWSAKAKSYRRTCCF